MKLLLVLAAFLCLGAHAQDTCDRVGEQICQEASFDYHENFYIARKQAFLNSLEKGPMKELICKNFVRKHGKVEANFSFERHCWPFGVGQIIKHASAQSCKDFKKFGADQFFIESCEALVGKELGHFIGDGVHKEIAMMIKEVKQDFEAAFADARFSHSISLALNEILEYTNPRHNLEKIEAGWHGPEKLCDPKNEDIFLCEIYKNSSKWVLSLGGYVFLPKRTIYAVIERKIAELVAEPIFQSLQGERILVYLRYIQDHVEKERFKGVFARSVLPLGLNRSVDKLIILSKYYAYKRARGDKNQLPRIGYTCYHDRRLGYSNGFYTTQNSYYSAVFNELHRFDQVEVLACPDGLASGEGLWGDYSPQSP